MGSLSGRAIFSAVTSATFSAAQRAPIKSLLDADQFISRRTSRAAEFTLPMRKAAMALQTEKGRASRNQATT